MFADWTEVPQHVFDHNNMTVERRIGPDTDETEFPSTLDGTY
ncbi:hypothetical protein AB0O76_40805 [Streptomyces sp. NPDC086554]